jgi:hypothetical protein
VGQRAPKPTGKQIAAARAKYAADVAAGRRIPLPYLGQIRWDIGGWQPVAGEGFEIVAPRRREAAPRKALDVIRGIAWSGN